MIVINEQAEKAKADYMTGMKSKDIAEKYGVSINTAKSWQKRQSGLERMHPKETKKYMDAIAAVSFGYAIPK